MSVDATVDPSKVRFSQNSVGTSLYPNTPTIPWKDGPPHTLPLNVISLPSGQYLSFDNRRLYSAIHDGLKQNHDLRVKLFVHEFEAVCSMENSCVTNILWAASDDDEKGAGVYTLSLESITWFGAISMRCAQQSSDFPLDGSSELPVLRNGRLELPDQFKLRNVKGSPVTQVPFENWLQTVTNLEFVMVQIVIGCEVFHSRMDIPTFLRDNAKHFIPVSFTFRSGSTFVSRMKAGGGVNGDDMHYDDAEIDMLMAEAEDIFEFDWVDQQLADVRGSAVLFAEALEVEPQGKEIPPYQYVRQSSVAERLITYSNTMAGRLRLCQDPIFWKSHELLVRELHRDKGVSVPQIAIQCRSLRAVIEHLPTQSANEVVNVLSKCPALANLLVNCILEESGQLMPRSLTVLLIQQSPLECIPAASLNPNTNIPSTMVYISAFRVSGLSPTRGRALCQGISKCVETQRELVWCLPIIRVMILCVSNCDSINVAEATRVSPAQRALLLSDMKKHGGISSLLNKYTLGPLDDTDKSQLYWVISFREDIHTRAVNELRRVLRAQSVMVKVFVDMFVSNIGNP